MEQGLTLGLIHKVWQGMKRIMQYNHISVYSPLWGNKHFEELDKLKGFVVWREKGIKYIAKLYTDNILKTFQDLQKTYVLPPYTFYQYLQLLHCTTESV